LADQIYAKRYNVAPEPEHHFSWVIAGLSTVIALAGAGAAYRAYGDGKEGEVPAPLRGAYALSRNKVYVDEIYSAVVVKPAEFLAAASRQFDGLLDALARLVAFVPQLLGAAFRPLHNGMVQWYALNMSMMLVALIVIIVFWNSR
jgi:NADH-quinone oxidoreductase subunit L